nr:MAG TPA: hypothetical protein [Caudoviricetes sp.]
MVKSDGVGAYGKKSCLRLAGFENSFHVMK